jgi:recombination protein RecA
LRRDASASRRAGPGRHHRGRERAKEFLRDNPDLRDELVVSIKRSRGLIPDEGPDEENEQNEQNEQNKENKENESSDESDD